MSGTPGYKTLVDRLRAELANAEQEFRQATTPEIKHQTLGRLNQARTRFSEALLSSKPKSSAGSA